MDFKSKDFLFSVLIFTGVFLSAAMFFTSIASNYGSSDVPGSLSSIQGHVNSTLQNVRVTSSTMTGNITSTPATDILGVISASVVTFPQILISGALSVLSIPSMMLTFITQDVKTYFFIDETLLSIFITLISVFLIYEIYGWIFKRD